ncbi:AraC family transcriptional regulator [Pedobacter sp. KBS0701]|uniref:helix-turn-helix domain-containing protein n=1 Tax=Pedobacter sp. KBS0701 TaxID=2578106 RepID=UPI00110D44F2|nr:helix-turn-helix domain-containing protein [Pedobacter sp. KBS0701]QDW27248.1 AraC family transcriptional regulator [Pedobacter sp. KBS0701]
MIKGIEHFSKNRIPSEMILALEFFDLLEKHFTEEHQSEFYAERMNMSLKRLNILLRTYYEKTVYEMIQARIHQEAEKLLIYTNMTVQQISCELGICTASFFCKCFREITGLTPQDFRKAVKAKALL